MEAEVVRDSILLVAGHLDTTMGGPEIDIGERNTSRRRSIYFQHAPDAQLEFLKLFDAADPGDCYRRKESITPHQSLAMANSQVSFDQARLLARRPLFGRRWKSFVCGAFRPRLASKQSWGGPRPH